MEGERAPVGGRGKVAGADESVCCFAKACAIGRSSKTVREFLEKNHEDSMDKDQTIKLAIKSLLEVVQTGAKSA
jgi:20S proteasome alpha/beta subunit